VNIPGDETTVELVRRFARPELLPQVRLVRRLVSPDRLDDVAGTTRREMQRLLETTDREPGPVAVGVGSRGITNLGAIVSVVLEELGRAGYEPFIVPAMGSHGGGTAEGQLEILETYGISERELGVPVRATMDTIVIGEIDGFPVAVDRHVVEAGCAFLVNRVKPHTDFRGRIESGIAKMAAIGLSKQRGAQALHSLGPEGLRTLVPAVGHFVSERLLLGAVAIVENELKETLEVQALRPDDVGGEPEAALLQRARDSLPRIPFSSVDVLVIEQMGKDISGVGLDPNVTGRWRITGVEEEKSLAVRCIVALRVSPASHGNALGIGLVDFAPSALLDDVDLLKTYVNGMTSGWSGLARTRLPIVLPTDRDAIAAAVATCGRAEAPRLVWIRDTLDTSVVAASEALWPEVGGRDDVEFLGTPFSFSFGDDCALPPLHSIVEQAEIPAAS
jgi:hypothetical protein